MRTLPRDALIWLTEFTVWLSKVLIEPTDELSLEIADEVNTDSLETAEATDEIWLEIDDDSPASSCAWAAVAPSQEVTPM